MHLLFRVGLRLLPLLLSLSVHGEVPAMLGYQGRLLAGTNLVNGPLGLSLRLYGVAAGGTAAYEDSNTVFVADGIYSTFLGDHTTAGTLAQALTNSEVWLETAVNGTALAPRERLAAVAYALMADGVKPGGVTADMLATGAVSSAHIADASVQVADVAANAFWNTTGNSGTQTGTHFIGTADAVPLEFRQGNVRFLKVEAGIYGQAERIAFGTDNEITTNAYHASILGGEGNSISAGYSMIGGGSRNNCSAWGGSILGGAGNVITPRGSGSMIGGGSDNVINGSCSVICGGGWNGWDFHYGPNVIEGEVCFIGGGLGNVIHSNASYSVINGGRYNAIFDETRYAVVAGGFSNSIGLYSFYSFIGGGFANQIGESSFGATIAGGGYDGRRTAGNRVGYNSSIATISGGVANRVESDVTGATIAGGAGHLVLSNAHYAMIAGGWSNIVAGHGGFAAGSHAAALHPGSFVWSDTNTQDFASVTANEFAVRSCGGIRFVTGIDSGGAGTSGVFVAAGSGTWTSLSDRHAKEHLSDVDVQAVLAKLAVLPVQQWNYRTQDAAIRHIGPMAQDFHAAFGLGDSERGIATVDADGVAFAAIQALHIRNERLERENASLRADFEQLEARLRRVEARH